jgi:hypothetical protein
VIPAGEPGHFAHRAELNGRRLIAVHNLTEKAGVIRLQREPDTRLIPLFSSTPKEAGPASLELEAYGYRWYREERSHA